MAKGLTPKHTACRKGTTVIIKLRNGDKIIDRFLERKQGKIITENHIITKKEMRSFAVYKYGHKTRTI